jgi:Tfp pilus assembly protein PilO
MNINPKNKFNLMVASLFFSFVAIGLCLNLLNGIVEKVKVSKIKVAEINRDIALLDKISEEKKQHENNIQKITNTLPSEYYEVSFFTTQIERLARNNNLILEISIDKSKKEERETYDSIAYALEIKGSYPLVSQFLSQMSRLPYHTIVERMNISNEEGELTTQITFKLFVEK